MIIEVNISKKYTLLLASLITIIALSVLVYTYGTNDPRRLGHSAGEIEFNEQASIVNTSGICFNGECKTSWPEFDIKCNNCGFGSWWGEASSSGRSLSYPSCDSGWTFVVNFNKIPRVQGAEGTNAIRDFGSSNSCCALCYKYN